MSLEPQKGEPMIVHLVIALGLLTGLAAAGLVYLIHWRGRDQPGEPPHSKDHRSD